MKIVAALAAALAMLAAAQSDDWGDTQDEWTISPEFAESKALCRAVRHLEPPAADRPDPAAEEALEGCDSEALYYGIGTARDPVRARLCAFLEARSGEDDVPFAGRAMLMTIYANGVGAKRDLDLATHLACRIGWAPAESHGRVSHLAGLKAGDRSGEEFSYCDDVTSGYAAGWCSAHDARIAGAERSAALADLGDGWPPAAKQAFARLQAAQDAFAEAHADGEVDMSGTLRSALWIAAKEAAADGMLDTLRRLGSGMVPAATAAQLEAADAALEAAYREALRGDYGDHPGAVTRNGVRKAQRAWLRYRDSFLAFGASAFPEVSRGSLAAWLTRQRTRMLTEEE